LGAEKCPREVYKGSKIDALVGGALQQNLGRARGHAQMKERVFGHKKKLPKEIVKKRDRKNTAQKEGESR